MKKNSLLVCVLFLLLIPVTVSAVGNISVISVPSGATILLNGANTGFVTPSIIENIPAGSLPTILLQKSGYQDASQTGIVVSDNATSPVSLTLTAVVAAPTISSITPSSGYNTTAVSITNLAGTGFATSGTPVVVLMKSGLTNITATSVSVTAIQVTCTFDITGKPAGYRDVVVTNPDGQSTTLANGFEIKNPGTAVTLSSITPNSGVVNTSVAITDLSGTGFLSTATILLRKTYENDIPGTSVTIVSSTKITGSFNLNGRTPGTYSVCVLNDGTTPTCSPTFTILTSALAANGSIYVKSSPSYSKIFLSNVYQGYTPLTLDNITPGTYTVLVRSAGYRDYSESVKVTAGNTSSVIASLVLSPEVTTAATTAPKTTVATVKTTAKSTAKVPTPWPSATATPASPVSILTILGAAGMGLIVLRKP